MTRTNLTKFVAIASAVAACAAVHAQAAFSDYDADSYSSNYGYNPNFAYSLAGSNVGGDDLAGRFTAGLTGVVTDVILPISAVDPGRYGGVTIDLMSDNAGALGSVLETWTLNPVGDEGVYTAPVVLTGDGSASLTQGTAYWISAVPTNVSFTGEWFDNEANGSGNVGEGGSIAYTYTGSGGWLYSTGTLPAMEIDVQATPEPAPLMALGLGVLAVVRRKRNRKLS